MAPAVLLALLPDRRGRGPRPRGRPPRARERRPRLAGPCAPRLRRARRRRRHPPEDRSLPHASLGVMGRMAPRAEHVHGPVRRGRRGRAPGDAAPRRRGGGRGAPGASFRRRRGPRSSSCSPIPGPGRDSSGRSRRRSSSRCGASPALRPGRAPAPAAASPRRSARSRSSARSLSRPPCRGRAPAGRSALYARVEALLRTEPALFEQTRGRVLLYEAGWETFREHPVAGLGLGSFQMGVPGRRRRDAPPSGEEPPITRRPSTWGRSPSRGSRAGRSSRSCSSASRAARAARSGSAPGTGRARWAMRRRRLPRSASSSSSSSARTSSIRRSPRGSRCSRSASSRSARTGARRASSRASFPSSSQALSPARSAVYAARAFETRTADAAFRFSPDAGVWAPEAEPDGRAFRWTAAAAAWRIAGTGPASTAVLPVRNARPDGRPVILDVWVDDALRGRVNAPRRRLAAPRGARGVRHGAGRPARRRRRDVPAARAGRPPRARHRNGQSTVAAGDAVSLLRLHPYDPRRKSRSLEIGPKGGIAFAAFALLAGGATALGLFAAPRLVSDIVHAAERKAVGETAQRGAEAFASVGRRALALGSRIAGDELFLARVAAVIEVPPPPGFPGDSPGTPAPTAADLENATSELARRTRVLELFRRSLAALPANEPGGPVRGRRRPVPPSSPRRPSPSRSSGRTSRPSRASPTSSPASRWPLRQGALGRPRPKARSCRRDTCRARPTRGGAASASSSSSRTTRGRAPFYGHLGSVSVRRGQRVGRGQTLAKVGTQRFRADAAGPLRGPALRERPLGRARPARVHPRPGLDRRHRAAQAPGVT